jgi:hypothetical protein
MKAKVKQSIRDYVAERFIETNKHLFVADIAEHFGTNGVGVRNALGYDDFIFEEDTRWSGHTTSGKFILCPCVEPTKTYLVKMIRALRA